VLGDARRNARRRRDPERGEARSGAREEGVDVPVVAAGELEDAVARRECTRKAHGAHRRLGAGGDEAYLLDGRDGVGDLGGELDLRLGGRAEARPALGRLHDRLERLAVGMAEQQRAPRHHPVDVAVAVDVLDVRTLAAAHEDGLVEPDGTHRANRRVDAAGNELERAAVQVAARA
jgi:hypothetical protein